jgi:hypothetical protein
MRQALVVGAITIVVVGIGVGAGFGAASLISDHDSTHHAATAPAQFCLIQMNIPHAPAMWVRVQGGPSFCDNAVNALHDDLSPGSETYIVHELPARREAVASQGGITIYAKPGTVSPQLRQLIQRQLQSVGQ